MPKVRKAPQPNDRFLADVSILSSNTPIWVIGTIVDCPNLPMGVHMVRLEESPRGGCFHGADLVSFNWRMFRAMKRIKSVDAKDRLLTFGELQDGMRVDVRVTKEGKFVGATVVGSSKKFIEFDHLLLGQTEMSINTVAWARLAKMGLVRMPLKPKTNNAAIPANPSGYN